MKLKVILSLLLATGPVPVQPRKIQRKRSVIDVVELQQTHSSTGRRVNNNESVLETSGSDELWRRLIGQLSMPTQPPFSEPTPVPTYSTIMPTVVGSTVPSRAPSPAPSPAPTPYPTAVPTQSTNPPTISRSAIPSATASSGPSPSPTILPSYSPTVLGSSIPTTVRSSSPSVRVSASPTVVGSTPPSVTGSNQPTMTGSALPSSYFTKVPGNTPKTLLPTQSPTKKSSLTPSVSAQPSMKASIPPTSFPTIQSSNVQTPEPTRTEISCQKTLLPTEAPTSDISPMPTPVVSIVPSSPETPEPSLLQRTTAPTVLPGTASPTTGPSVAPSGTVDLFTDTPTISQDASSAPTNSATTDSPQATQSPTQSPTQVPSSAPTPVDTMAQPSLAPVPDAQPIPPSPGFPPCNVCGDDGSRVTLPSAIVMIPDQDPITCANFQLAGDEGFISEEFCPVVFAFTTNCGCSLPSPATTTSPTSTPLTGNPTQSPTLASASPTTMAPSVEPTSTMSKIATFSPSTIPTEVPSSLPTGTPSIAPISPSFMPSIQTSAPIVSPTMGPQSQTTSSPVTGPIPPSPGFPRCNVCGPTGQRITNPNAIVTIPGQDPITCLNFQRAGDFGFIEEVFCSFVTPFTSTCGCSDLAREGPIPTPSRTTPPAQTPIPPTPGFPTCNICGDESSRITNLNAVIVIPGEEPVTCSNLQLAGDLGFIPEDVCPELVPLATPCNCSSETVPSTSFPTMVPGSPPVAQPTPPSPGFPECNICGQNGSRVMFADTFVTIPGQDPITCRDLQRAGDLGFIDEQYCPFIPRFATNCGCDSSPSVAPVEFAPFSLAPVSQPVPPSPGFGMCNVCGSVDLRITRPDAIIEIPGEDPISCESFQLAGDLGFIDDEFCSLVPPFTAPCGCNQTSTPSPIGITINAAPPRPPSSVPTAAITHSPKTPTPTGSSSPSIAPTIIVPTETPKYVYESTSAPTAYSTYSLVNSASRSRGQEFHDPTSYQSSALLWLVQSGCLNHLSNARVLQRFALACLFYATNAVPNDYTDREFGVGTSPPSWISSSLWTTDSDECLWFGITCDTEGQVISINLSNNRLSGRIPLEITYLEATLHKLDLSNTSVQVDSTPGLEAIGRLMNLVYLRLGSTNLEAEGIPSEIANLSHLIDLDLSQTQLSGQFSATALQNLGSLVSLDVSGCGLMGTIPSELAQLTDIEQLQLSSNALSGTVPTELGDLINLKTFDLSHNNITGSMPNEVCFNIPPLGRLSTLQADCVSEISCSCCSSCF